MRPFALVVAILLATGCLAPIEERLRASNVEEPRWSVGDWWTYNVRSELYDVAGEVTVVVMQATGDGYILGVPADAEANAALLFHMPAIGPVRRDLAWDVHETRFEPAKWPLEDGREWDTTWISAPVHLRSRLNGTLWEIDNAGHEQDANMVYNLTYDPAVKAFTRFTRTGLDGVVRQSVELVSSGTDHAGTLRAPLFVKVMLLESRTRGVVAGGLPAAPNPTFTPDETVDTLLVGCIVGGDSGEYHAQVLDPDGATVCQRQETLQPGDTLYRSMIAEVPTAEGEWEARLLAVGQGSATVEVLGWKTLNATLSANATA